MGRKTYLTILEMAPEYHYTDKIGFVFTRDKSLRDTKYKRFISDNIASFVNELKAKEGKDIWLVGGGEIVKYFIDNKLIDQIIISIHPKILGMGLPLFIPPLKETDLKLTNCSRFESGLVQLDYDVIK
jgi:dihydrofolate reductase